MSTAQMESPAKIRDEWLASPKMAWTFFDRVATARTGTSRLGVRRVVSLMAYTLWELDWIPRSRIWGWSMPDSTRDRFDKADFSMNEVLADELSGRTPHAMALELFELQTVIAILRIDANNANRTISERQYLAYLRSSSLKTCTRQGWLISAFMPAGEFQDEWRTSTVLALAGGMAATDGFSAMPILADALQDAGCNLDELLSDMRNPDSVWARGAWILDRILDR